MKTSKTVRCLMCGVVMGADAEAYARHTREKHSMGFVAPERTSGRSTAEIVRAVETRLKDFIILPEENKIPLKVHDPSCRCTDCFNAQLDRIIAGDGITWGQNENVVE